LDPATAAWLGEAIEIVGPPLLMFGLATRFAALPMLVLSLVIQFSYQALDQHLFWALLSDMVTSRVSYFFQDFRGSVSRRSGMCNGALLPVRPAMAEPRTPYTNEVCLHPKLPSRISGTLALMRRRRVPESTGILH
jgi:DoxX